MSEKNEADDSEIYCSKVDLETLPSILGKMNKEDKMKFIEDRIM